MIKAIIIDDELDAIESLKWEINRYCKNIEILDTFSEAEEAISAINYLKPDCVFLDIEMPEMDGFQLLSKLKFRDFDLVITTAYDNYAIQAFKESAIDYLLKPIDHTDIEKVSQKILKNKQKNNLGEELKEALRVMAPKEKLIQKIPFPLQGKTIFIPLEDILYCKSDGSYTTVFIKSGEKHLLSKKIKDVEKLCNSKQMIRVHQSYLVNATYIKEYIKSEGYYLVLDNGESIPVSKANRKYLQEVIRSV